MTYEFKARDNMPCEAEVFKINGIDADMDDFGGVNLGHIPWLDDDEDMTECEMNGFFGEQPTEEILEKYGITEEEYDEILDNLNGEFFGKCSACH